MSVVTRFVRSSGGVGAVALVTVVGLVSPVAGVGASPADPSAWSTPQRLARSQSGYVLSDSLGLATTPDGRRTALVMAGSPLGGRENDVVRVYEWSRGAWRSRGPIPGGGSEADDVTVQWAKADGRALAVWRGESDEGATDVRASVRDAGRWTAARDFGKGVPAGRIAADGSRALVAWYAEDEEDGATLGLQSAWWADGGWQAVTTHAGGGTIVTPLDLTGVPLVAVSADGSTAVLVWSQDGVVRASWWTGGAWSAPMLGPVGVVPHALALDPAGTAASLVVTRAVGTALDFARIPLSASGFGVEDPLGLIAGSGALVLRHLEVNADGSAVLAVLASGSEWGPATLALWPPGAESPYLTNVGTLQSVDVALPAKGPYAVAVLRPETADGVLARDRVMAWDGNSWNRIGRVRTCAEAHPSLAVSARGTTKVLAWVCPPAVYVTRTAGR